MSKVTLRPFRSDDVDWLVEAHAAHFAENDGFDDSFGPSVRSILNDFVATHDPTREQGWIVDVDGARAGSIFCVGLDDETAKLRLFFVSSVLRGQGAGKLLLNTCCAFARDAGYRKITL